jgi:hypothetical protein
MSLACPRFLPSTTEPFPQIGKNAHYIGGSGSEISGTLASVHRAAIAAVNGGDRGYHNLDNV